MKYKGNIKKKIAIQIAMNKHHNKMLEPDLFTEESKKSATYYCNQIKNRLNKRSKI